MAGERIHKMEEKGGFFSGPEDLAPEISHSGENLLEPRVGGEKNFRG